MRRLEYSYTVHKSCQWPPHFVLMHDDLLPFLSCFASPLLYMPKQPVFPLFSCELVLKLLFLLGLKDKQNQLYQCLVDD